MTEHILDSVPISPDQFLDCATALIHTILFVRSVDRVVTPKRIDLEGLDIGFQSAENSKSAQYIQERLQPMQAAVSNGMKDAWIILSLGYNTPKKGWFREAKQLEVWEKWCISFTFKTLEASIVREALLHSVFQISYKACASDIPRPEPGSTFEYQINLPTDRDWGSSKEFVQLVKKVVAAPSNLLD